MNIRLLPIFPALLACAAPVFSASDWAPVQGHIMTRWAKDVSPTNAWPEYPRPQLVRSRWLNLNGLWDYAIQGESREWKGGPLRSTMDDPLLKSSPAAPTAWDGRILVPFAIESALSGVGKLIRPDQLLWYRRTFEVPGEWNGQRVLLHFEAVDWHTIVVINGKRIGENRGGNTPFSFDITDALRPGGAQELMLTVWDPSNEADQADGKQSLPESRRGYHYTPTTGIWQTVWLEPVPAAHIGGLRIEPDVDRGEVRVSVDTAATEAVRVTVLDGSREIATASGKPGSGITLRLPAAKLWTPEQPFLYQLKVTLGADTVSSYFGMRKIAIQNDKDGIARYFLNNRPLRFQFGPLDQGYWPDGILTPPTDKAAEADIQYLKDIGCNMVRVHVNVRPERWYYHADRLGILVWQDMVSSRTSTTAIIPTRAAQWELEQKRMIEHLRNHPAIIKWVVFNESWGQYDTDRLSKWTKSLDPSRIVTAASGWNDVAGLSDVRDIHDYSYYPSIPLPERERPRAIVLGEFGGFDVPVAGHIWNPAQVVKPTSGGSLDGPRQKYADGKQWLAAYGPWIEAWRYLIARFGLNAGVYTQIADVEHELNGWLTYDREVSKISVADLRRLHQSLYLEPPVAATLVKAAGQWRHRAEAQAGWSETKFDDAGWQQGSAPFGDAKGTAVPGLEVYLRRDVELSTQPKRPAIVGYQSPGEADLYVNGKLVLTFTNRGTRDGMGATVIPIPAGLSAGKNQIAVRARFEKSSPGYFDLEIVDLQP